ncbi:MAG: hypothetical protein QG657_2791, partial [Acidobacteriota bacterium]|nr:hypothetical protein [Acidobacteriota bacterium]
VYFVSREEMDISEVRKFLAAEMPDYMVPSYFMRLEQIPLTPNGKTDYRALPLPSPEGRTTKQRIAPTDEIEKNLTHLWAELLNLDENIIGIDDNFFHLGGYSLKGAALASRIHNLIHVQAPLAEIFKNPTIRRLACYIREQRQGGFSLETHVRDEQIILLRKGSADRHVFFIHPVSGEVEAYMDLVNLLPGTYHYWGIRVEGPEHFVPRDFSIEEVAGSYIEKIGTIQHHGPYYIIGWSIGGTIAFEMQRRLEEVGEGGEGSGGGVLVFIDSAPPALPFVDHNVPVKKTRQQGKKNSPPLKKLIPRLEQLKEREITYYLAVARAFGRARDRYIPGGKIRSAVHFISARDREMANREDWNYFCETPVTFYEVAGDHFSILEAPNVSSLADIIAALLNT